MQRYYENVMPTYDQFEEEWKSTQPLSAETLLGYFKPILEQGRQYGLNLIQKQPFSAKSSRDYTIYSGQTGVALMYLKLAMASTDSTEKQAHLIACEKHLQEARNLIEKNLNYPHHVSPTITFLCGIPGVYAVTLHFHYVRYGSIREDDKIAKELLTQLHDSKSQFAMAVFNDPRMSDELLYGRVGYLYALLYVYHYTNAPINEELITQLVTTIIEHGKRLSAQEKDLVTSHVKLPPLFYRWHGKDYTGAAHGLAGIFTVLLLVDRVIKMKRQQFQPKNHTSCFLDKEQCDLIRHSMLTLLEIRSEKTNNYPSQYLKRDHDELVQFCHGAPGFLFMCALAYEHFSEAVFLEAAKDMAEKTIWKQGLLTKGSGLCHGIIGNAYAFVALYRITNKICYLYQALAFASFLITEKEKVDQQRPIPYDSPYSLLEGVAGDIYFYTELLALQKHMYRITASTSSPSGETVNFPFFPSFVGIELSNPIKKSSG
jgi:lantibiotic modifying enzyme